MARRPIILILALGLFISEGAPGKSDDYKKLWKTIEKQENDGLTRTALKTVGKILAKARAEENAGQIVKAFIHRLKYETMISEDGLVKAMQKIADEAKAAKHPIKPLLYSMRADLLNRYYRRHRYRIFKRTQTSKKSNDIRTWTLRQITEEMISLHNKALLEPEKSQAIKIDLYDDVLTGGYSTRELRPTLYDFLAHRAISFFVTGESYLSQPAVRFQLKGETDFAPARDFISQAYRSKEKEALKFNAIKTLQAATAFRLNSDDREALADVELIRLQFVYTKSIHPEKQKLYLAALKRTQAAYKEVPRSVLAAYHRAKIIQARGRSYQPLKSDESKWLLKEARDICIKARRAFPKSVGARSCEALEKEIERKSFSLKIEEVSQPQKPMRALLEYRNIKKLHLRVIKLDDDDRDKVEKLYSDKRTRFYLDVKPVTEWSVELPDDGDFQQHAVEVKVPQMKNGYYVLLGSWRSDFKFKENAISHAGFWASRIGYVEQRKHNEIELYVFDRVTGHPLIRAEVNVWLRKYGFFTREYYFSKTYTHRTNRNGFVTLPAGDKYRTFRLEFEYKDDRLDQRRNYYQSKYYARSKSGGSITYFFSDRSIYRPGQTVYFKGIALQRDGDRYKIDPGRSTVVTLYNVNHQSVATLDLVANEYGTFSGRFDIPTGSLNGQWRLHSYRGSHYFSVEEYKRPKFEVKFDALKGNYALGDEVKLKGVATAFAGHAIDSARVKYRVVRQTRYPYWWMYWGYSASGKSVEVGNGELKTDGEGKFTVRFKAQPDESVDPKTQPVFEYQVSADVIDVTGETHSASARVNLGYVSVKIVQSIPGLINKGGKLAYRITTTNLNGQHQPAELQLAVIKLQPPERIFRRRLWSRPDRHLIKKTEYYRLFPNDAFGDEYLPQKWKRGKTVLKRSFQTKEKEKTKLALANVADGHYVIVLKTKDKSGVEIKTEKYIRLFETGGQNMPFPENSWFHFAPKKAQPGDRITFYWGSSNQNAQAFYEVVQRDQVFVRKFVAASNSKFRFHFDVKEKHRGGLVVRLVTVRNGRLHHHRHNISVPWDNKKLKVEFATFRDKLLPGSKEEWRLTVKGPDKDKVAAEMLAGMYDASLDTFRHHGWGLGLYPGYGASHSWSGAYLSNVIRAQLSEKNWNKHAYVPGIYYDGLNWFGFSEYGYYRGRRRYSKKAKRNGGSTREEADEAGALDDAPSVATAGEAKEAEKPGAKPKPKKDSDKNGRDAQEPEPEGEVKIRKNLNETAFFFPHLKTNAKGEVIIAFTIPEALTRWKFMALTHTKDLKIGYASKEVVTQKDFMIIPNAPRFLRQGDTIFFTAKVTNLSENELAGKATLQFLNGKNMKPVASMATEKADFTASKGKSAALSWKVKVPDTVQVVSYRVIARAGDHSDGEEAPLPVLTNRMLVTETMPLPVRGKGTTNFKFKKLINSASSSTLKHHRLTLEFTSNPAWYAVQALPYLMEYPYECAEQTFSRFYANSLASHIANSKPRIKEVFEKWKNTDALLSNLEKNQELKAVLLQETPWVLQAQSESKRKKQVGLLFDLNRMSREMSSALRKIIKLQTPNGGWPWFAGMPDNRYITQHIIAGLGHLKHLGVDSVMKQYNLKNMLRKGVAYLDDRIREDYQSLIRNKIKLDQRNISYLQIHYLYARSYFTKQKVEKRNQEAFKYWKGQAAEYWLNGSHYMQGMTALALHRFGDRKTPKKVLRSIKENALFHDELGMYWKSAFGYYWYQAPIERQALLIEAFSEITKDTKAVDDMKVWLLKQKQVQDWKTTKATVEAVYALLLEGSDWLSDERLVRIKMAETWIDPNTDKSIDVEAGTGHFKKAWEGLKIKPAMGNVTVEKPTKGVAWGGLYWQYFEDLDKITPAKTPLQLDKKLYLQKTTSRGLELVKITGNTKLTPGDLIKVRVELRSDRTMEYVHMKDMRASSLEPTNVISRYKWQDGLGYYESTKDASTNFFISWLPKGTYVFEYPLRVTHKGDFSNGITTIQSMYAPEFSSHSEGVRIKID